MVVRIEDARAQRDADALWRKAQNSLDVAADFQPTPVDICEAAITYAVQRMDGTTLENQRRWHSVVGVLLARAA